LQCDKQLINISADAPVKSASSTEK